MSSNEFVSYDQFKFDFSRCEVHLGTSTTELEPKVMQVLATLHARQGEVISQQDIFEQVWPGRIYSQSLVQRAIALIRKALKEDAASAKYLITYPKKGYSLVSHVNKPEVQNSQRLNKVNKLFLILMVSVMWLTYLFISENSPTIYTSISPLTKQHSNDFALSQNPLSEELLFIRKNAERYELWQKSPDGIQKLYSSESELQHAFWFNGSPAFTQLNKFNATLFIQIAAPENLQSIYETSLAIATAPLTNGPLLYFTSQDTLYEFDTVTNESRILHVFTDIKALKDISFSQRTNSIAVLVDKGQLNHQVNLVELDNLTVKELYRDEGKYNSINWHPHEASLLLTKANTLVRLNTNGVASEINYATEKELASATYGLKSQVIYLEQNELNISLKKIHSIEESKLLSELNYSGANLFPKNNDKNSTLLFQSDYSGFQTLYLKDGQNESVLAQANKGEHINGFTWSTSDSTLAYAINKEVFIQGEKGQLKTIKREHSLYIRAWFHNEPKLLVHQIINGKPYPAALNITNNTLEQLNNSPASCAILDHNNTLYFVQNDQQLIKYTSDGRKQVVFNLMSDKYQDLFVSKRFLYASVKNNNTYYVQRFDLVNLEMSQHELPDSTILAGVNSDESIWLYSDIQYKSSLYKLF